MLAEMARGRSNAKLEDKEAGFLNHSVEENFPPGCRAASLKLLAKNKSQRLNHYITSIATECKVAHLNEKGSDMVRFAFPRMGPMILIKFLYLI